MGRRRSRDGEDAGRSGTTAGALEFVFGLFQVFGIGHIYAGNVVLGVFFMVAYWLVTALNYALVHLYIGYVTWPLCFLAMIIVSPILASSSCSKR